MMNRKDLFKVQVTNRKQTILKEGDECDTFLYLVHEGTAKLEK